MITIKILHMTRQLELHTYKKNIFHRIWITMENVRENGTQEINKKIMKRG